MTAAQAIALCDALQPNDYAEAIKLSWLTTLEASLYQEIIAWHADAPARPAACAPDTVLQAGEPYSSLYADYLAAMMHMQDGEYERYTNAMLRYNSAYCAFAGYYNRTHAPAKARNVHY
ncbi:MAG: hypothetical protein Q4E65_07705 [Clostridia bacterium]|nr:hypothetical protein [Clostridia bacterium]